MASYATLTQYKAQSELPLPADSVINKALIAATVDIDNILPGEPNLVTGLRIYIDDLQQWQNDGLVRATVYQAEFRIVKGPEYFLEIENEVITGPDFTISRQTGRSTPGLKHFWHARTLMELRHARLLVTGARAAAGAGHYGTNELRFGGGNAWQRIWR